MISMSVVTLSQLVNGRSQACLNCARICRQRYGRLRHVLVLKKYVP